MGKKHPQITIGCTAPFLVQRQHCIVICIYSHVQRSSKSFMSSWKYNQGDLYDKKTTLESCAFNIVILVKSTKREIKSTNKNDRDAANHAEFFNKEA